MKKSDKKNLGHFDMEVPLPKAHFHAISWNPATLAAMIEDELRSLDKLIDDVQKFFKGMPEEGMGRMAYEESLALKLHNFYSGCERIFDRVSVEIDKKSDSYLEERASWHKDLLKRMSLEINGLRPAMISPETFKLLEDYLTFRHKITKMYGYELDSDRLSSLVEKAPKVYKDFKSDVLKFLGFLKKLSG